MLTLKDVATYIVTLSVVPEDHIYCGKLDSKKPKSIGVYNLRRNGVPIKAIGPSSYRIKSVSLLVHWSKNSEETELAADLLYQKLESVRNVTINNKKIYYISLRVSEPVDVGTDDAGVYEMVIEADIYYEREE